MAIHARLLLESRGIERTTRTLAGALLEAEMQQWVMGTCKVWIEQQKQMAKKPRWRK